jgi:hypothetical protein
LKQNVIRVTVPLPQDLYERLIKDAETEDRPLGTHIAHILKQEVKA